MPGKTFLVHEGISLQPVELWLGARRKSQVGGKIYLIFSAEFVRRRR